MDEEKSIDSKEVDEITLVIEKVEKSKLKEIMVKSFEGIEAKHLHECYYIFLTRDGTKEHHSLGKIGGKNHHPPPILMSLDKI